MIVAFKLNKYALYTTTKIFTGIKKIEDEETKIIKETTQDEKSLE
ncbi:MAG: hypothetical protein PHS54_01080 [Clostridia bacterium]|nr:hypothetical protein [Clostridia bacterium]